MTLYNIIRDFFVQYVFGGYHSSGEWYVDNWIGQLFTDIGGTDYFTTANIGLPLGNIYDGLMEGETKAYIMLADWLSTTATIITLVALFIGIALLTIKLFKIVSNIVALR